MSGICGVYSPERPDLAGELHLERMLAAIGHRGRAARRTFVDRSAGLAVGHVAGPFPGAAEGHEPPGWHAGAGRVVALDGILVDDVDGVPPGAPGRRRGAAEVARCLELHPRDPWGRLEGHFGLAAWTPASRELSLCRDPLAARPLYYAHVEPRGPFLFASEPKGILAHPAVRPAVDPEALAAYLSFGYVPAPLCSFAGLRKVFPGEVVTVDARGRPSTRQTWRMPPYEPRDATVEELAEETRARVLDRAARYLDGAGPLGVFLSGGVDSTILVGLLRLLGHADVHTFTLAFRTDADRPHLWVDLGLAERVAQRFETRHHPLVLDRGHDPRSWLPRVWRQFDEPMHTPNVYSKFLLSREARASGVETCLAGTAAENLFASTRTKRLEKLRRRGGAAATDLDIMVLRYCRTFSFEEQRDLLAEPACDSEEVARGLLDRYSADVEAEDLGDRMVTAMIRMMIAEKGIGVQDRSSSLNGVEIRHPLHDTRLLAFSRTIPSTLKGSRDQALSKAVFKAAFRDLLPEEVDRRKKQGFPTYYWHHGQVEELRRRLLSPEGLARTGLLREEAVRRVLAEDVEGADTKSPGKRTWGLLVLQAWYELHVNGSEELLGETAGPGSV